MQYDSSVYARFMKYVKVCEHGVGCTECCWPWMGGLSEEYGIFQIGTNQRSQLIRTHVFMWEWEHYTTIHYFICHTCDWPPCCQPSHLWNGTSQENSEDMVRKGRQWSPILKGERNGQAKLNIFDIHFIFALNRQGFTLNEITKYVPIKTSQIWRILNGESWGHLGLHL